MARFELATSCSQSRRNEPDYPTLGILVEVRRFELLALCLQSRCSTKWAKPPNTGSPSWARTTDIDINSVAQLPTVLSRNISFGTSGRNRTGTPFRARDFKSLMSTYFITLALPLIDSTHSLWRRADFGVGCFPSLAIAVVVLGLIDGPTSPPSVSVPTRYPLAVII